MNKIIQYYRNNKELCIMWLLIIGSLLVWDLTHSLSQRYCLDSKGYTQYIGIALPKECRTDSSLPSFRDFKRTQWSKVGLQ